MATAYLNCATGTLDTYVPSAEAPWNDQRIKHLYRRIGFGANAQMLSLLYMISGLLLRC